MKPTSDESRTSVVTNAIAYEIATRMLGRDDRNGLVVTTDQEIAVFKATADRVLRDLDEFERSLPVSPAIGDRWFASAEARYDDLDGPI